MPTLLDILKISSKNIMQGVSLVPLLKGKTNPNSFSISESFGEKPTKAVRTLKFKFIENYGMKLDEKTYELYDLEKDPKELNNLAEEMPQEVESFKAKLRDYALTCTEIRDLIVGKNFKDTQVTLNEEDKEALKSLGYVQ